MCGRSVASVRRFADKIEGQQATQAYSSASAFLHLSLMPSQPPISLGDTALEMLGLWDDLADMLLVNGIKLLLTGAVELQLLSLPPVAQVPVCYWTSWGGTRNHSFCVTFTKDLLYLHLSDAIYCTYYVG